MPRQASAEIIPFPNRPPADPADSAHRERLERALAGLDSAIAEQRKAMAAWRNALDDLKLSARSLGDGLRRYSGELNKLDADVSAVRARSVGLSEWADGAMAREKAARPPISG